MSPSSLLGRCRRRSAPSRCGALALRHRVDRHRNGPGRISGPAGGNDAAIREFHQRRAALPAAGLREQEGEIADISFRIRGAGPPLVLLPLDLSPGQWESLIPALSARYCSVILGAAPGPV